MRVLGAILIILGIIALAYGGITYTKRDTVLDAGPIEATVDEKKTIPLPPILGAAALLAGALMVTRRKRIA